MSNRSIDEQTTEEIIKLALKPRRHRHTHLELILKNLRYKKDEFEKSTREDYKSVINYDINKGIITNAEYCQGIHRQQFTIHLDNQNPIDFIEFIRKSSKYIIINNIPRKQFEEEYVQEIIPKLKESEFRLQGIGANYFEKPIFEKESLHIYIFRSYLISNLDEIKEFCEKKNITINNYLQEFAITEDFPL